MQIQNTCVSIVDIYYTFMLRSLYSKSYYSNNLETLLFFQINKRNAAKTRLLESQQNSVLNEQISCLQKERILNDSDKENKINTLREHLKVQLHI